MLTALKIICVAFFCIFWTFFIFINYSKAHKSTKEIRNYLGYDLFAEEDDTNDSPTIIQCDSTDWNTLLTALHTKSADECIVFTADDIERAKEFKKTKWENQKSLR